MKTLSWVKLLSFYARRDAEQYVHLRGRKQRKGAIARLFPLTPEEHTPYRRGLWTRICRLVIEEHRVARRQARVLRLRAG